MQLIRETNTPKHEQATSSSVRIPIIKQESDNITNQFATSEKSSTPNYQDFENRFAHNLKKHNGKNLIA